MIDTFSTVQVQDIPNDTGYMIGVAAGPFHSALVTNTGTVYTFGSNSNGQLGTETTVDARLPQKVVLPNGVQIIEVALGAVHSIFLTVTGQVYTVGEKSTWSVG